MSFEDWVKTQSYCYIMMFCGRAALFGLLWNMDWNWLKPKPIDSLCGQFANMMLIIWTKIINQLLSQLVCRHIPKTKNPEIHISGFSILLIVRYYLINTFEVVEVV